MTDHEHTHDEMPLTPGRDMEVNKVVLYYEAYYYCSLCNNIERSDYHNRQDIPSLIPIEGHPDNPGELVEIIEVIGTVVWRKNNDPTLPGT